VNDQIKSKIIQIRENWQDPMALADLLTEWDEKYRHYTDKVEGFIGPTLTANWRKIAEKNQSHTVKDLITLLLKDFQDANYELEDIENGIRVITKKCPIAAVYTSLGRQKYGKFFHCFADPYICAGFNPSIKYEKKSSLMAGDEFCEHYYQIED
jgi:hypothetical protein